MQAAHLPASLLIDAGHNVSNVLRRCMDKRTNEMFDCAVLNSSLVWRHELGNTLVINAKELERKAIADLSFELSVETIEYLDFEPSVYFRVFIQEHGSHPLPGYQEVSAPPGFTTMMQIGYRIIRNLQKCERSDKLSGIFYPGAYSEEACLRSREKQWVLDNCHCMHNEASGEWNHTSCNADSLPCINNFTFHSSRSEACLPPCNFVEWIVSKSITNARLGSFAKDNLKVHIRFAQTGNFRFEERFQLSSLYTIAGLLGVQSGSSMISFAEIALLLISAPCVICKSVSKFFFEKDLKMKQKMQKEFDAEEGEKKADI